MKRLTQIWNTFLIKPFEWVWYYFSQPDRFSQKVEELKASSQHRKFLFRLGLPTFLIPYTLECAGLILNHFSMSFNLPLVLFAAAVGTLLGVAIGIVWELVENIPVGVGSGLSLGFLLGMCMAASWWVGLGIGVSIVAGLTLGMKDLEKYKPHAVKDFILRLEQFYSKAAGETEVATRGAVKSLLERIVGTVGFLVFAFAGGIATHIEAYRARRIGTAILSGTAIGALGGVAVGILDGNIGGGIWLGITLSIYAGILGGIALSILEGTIPLIIIGLGGGVAVGASITLSPMIWTNALTFVVSIAPAIAAGIAWSIGMNIGVGATGKFTVTNPSTFTRSLLGSLVVGIAIGSVAGYGAVVVFATCFILNSYRIPLYLASSLSLEKVYQASKKNPSEVFKNLQGSALYWSEQAPFPLPFLSEIMLIAARQNAEQTINEIQFIQEKKAFQISEVWEGLLEVIFQGLEERKTLNDIAGIHSFLVVFLQGEFDLLLSKWKTRFSYVYEASRDASRYRNSLSWHTRKDALTSMIANLRKITYKKKTPSSGEPTDEDKRNERLKSLVDKWLDRARVKLEELEQEPHSTDQINNPYVVGSVLALETSPFVGRRDIAQQLEQDLRRGSHRPTFFLSGERRMGKSSLLRQLPRLLDDRVFLPIFYDLQAPGVRSSAAAFLGTVSEEIEEALKAKGEEVEQLARTSLHEIIVRNEAEVYFFFNEWLKKIERILERDDLVLLLSFDEFEALFENSEEGKGQRIDLSLLFSWFRSIIQDRPRLALLFSGGRTIDEISNDAGINWASYFVNVQTLKVSFLRENEARQLITQPKSDYPIDQIFGDGVVDEIIALTGCHPFLVQAVCSELVIYLNASSRDRAKSTDVKIAIDQVLENFHATYFGDLWKRTDENQRACLIAIKHFGKGDLRDILQKSNLEEKTTRRTLQTLLKRDLIAQESGNYRIAAPIFAEWVESNS